MTNNLVFNLNDKPYTTDKIISKYSSNDLNSVKKQITSYKSDLEDFGVLRFKIAKPQKGSKGGRPSKTYLLNEQQATLLITYLDNTEQVRQFKKELVHQFFIMRQELTQCQPVHKLQPIGPVRGLRLPNGDIQLTVLFHEQPVRILSADIDGSRLIVSRDANIALGYGNNHQAVKDRVEVQHRALRQVASLNPKGGRGGLQSATVLDEIGFSQLIERSRKPEALELSDFLTGTAFPKLDSVACIDDMTGSAVEVLTEQTQLPLYETTTAPEALLKLAGIAQQQGNVSVYEDLIQRAISSVN